jgi:hypothetical protein
MTVTPLIGLRDLDFNGIHGLNGTLFTANLLSTSL